LTPSAKVYWSRVIFAILTAILSSLLELNGYRVLSFGIVMYLLSYYIIRYGLDIAPESVGGSSGLMFTGFGSFLLVWMTILALVYTLFRI